MNTNKREEALRMLYKQLREAKTALGQAQSKPHVPEIEIFNLERKIAVIDWMIPLVIKAEGEDDG